MFDERTCHMFGDCISAGKGAISVVNNKLLINREKISDPSALRNICPSKALIVTGQDMSVDQIMSEIGKDIPFYETSGGGVTLSGGEPFSQGPDLKELIHEIKAKKIHLSVETSLHVPWEILEGYLDLVDVFLADLKHLDPEKFTKFTGGNASLVTANFRKLDGRGNQIVVRIPVIPTFNYSEQELFSIIDFAAGLKNAREISFIPFHSLAREKYTMLGKEYIFENQKNIEKADLIKYVEYAEKKGLSANILN